MLRQALLLSLVLAPATALADWRQDFPRITFGAATGENQQSAAQRWGVFGEYLRECMGIERVEVRVANDYSAIIQAMAQEDVHLAWLGPSGYAVAWDISGGNVVPVAMDVSPDNDLGYRWVIAVRADSTFQSLEDLEGASLGWASPTSTSGFVLPMQYFRERGFVDENNEPVFFGSLVQTGSHDNGLVAVIRGSIDATLNWYYSPAAGNHTRAAGNGIIDLDDIRFVFESDLIPNAPFTTLKNLPDDMRFQMSACFVNMQFTHPEAFAEVTRDVFGGFALVSPEAYEPFIQIRLDTK